MGGHIKNQEEILTKLGIVALNPMQEAAQMAIHNKKDVILLSPTGSGKTVGFALPIIQQLEAEQEGVQVLILVPSRELALQIEQVIRNMGTGYKTNAAYGGRPIAKDKAELQNLPAILIGTPGRIADHIRRGTFNPQTVTRLVLDEFDKSLEIGFEDEMREILSALTNLEKKVLTSATQGIEIPDFVALTNPTSINFLSDGIIKLEQKLVVSETKDKLPALVRTLRFLGNQPGIVFCNFKESIDRVSKVLERSGIAHGCFHGGLEQQERERVLIKFRNGTHQLIVATDLAARGLDIPEIKFIIHYHLPLRAEEFTHRNGRTARMKQDGTAYILKWQDEVLPDFIKTKEIAAVENPAKTKPIAWTTVLVSGGRRDKISKGDIAGLFLKQGGLKKDDLGIIELKQDCAFVGVKKNKLHEVLPLVNHVRLKKKKVRITEV
jgi:superfamily II DNA/RNA helicase